MEQYVKDQIVYGIKYLPVNLLKSFFIPQSSEETKALRKKGFICGVCHPNGDYEKIREANISWVRFDIPVPFDKEGNIRESYSQFKVTCEEYAKNGIKVMAVTPYPHDYMDMGIDSRTETGREELKKSALFLINDLRDCIGGLQITNEMGIPRFTIPYTMDEAAEFIGVQLEAIYPVRGDIIIGYNSAGPQADLHLKMKPYLKYCDYVGIDVYIGCFANVGGLLNMYDILLRYLWAFTGKPISLQEFGYIGDGKPKSKKEKTAILNSYGAKNKKDAKRNIAAFVDKLPEHFGNHIKYLSSNDESRYYDLIFKSDLVNHLFRELPGVTVIPGYPHTPEGQAKFFTSIIERLYNHEFMAGAVIYSYSDSDRCYVCGQGDCPTETRWGLVTEKGEPKPSYYAVKKVFGKIRGIE